MPIIALFVLMIVFGSLIWIGLLQVLGYIIFCILPPVLIALVLAHFIMENDTSGDVKGGLLMLGVGVLTIGAIVFSFYFYTNSSLHLWWTNYTLGNTRKGPTEYAQEREDANTCSYQRLVPSERVKRGHISFALTCRCRNRGDCKSYERCVRPNQDTSLPPNEGACVPSYY